MVPETGASHKVAIIWMWMYGYCIEVFPTDADVQFMYKPPFPKPSSASSKHKQSPGFFFPLFNS